MALYDTVSASIKAAMKDGDKDRLLVFRGLKSAIDFASKSGQEITDELVEKIVKTEVKKRKEAIAMYNQAGATDKANQEEAELAILKPLLPAEMSSTEVEQIVDQIIQETGASGAPDMGKVMGLVSQKVAGQADMSAVSALVRQKLVG